LKQERDMNRHQEDQLKCLKAEIEALNERWRITDEKIKSGETLYQLIHRT